MPPLLLLLLPPSRPHHAIAPLFALYPVSALLLFILISALGDCFVDDEFGFCVAGALLWCGYTSMDNSSQWAMNGERREARCWWTATAYDTHIHKPALSRVTVYRLGDGMRCCCWQCLLLLLVRRWSLCWLTFACFCFNFLLFLLILLQQRVQRRLLVLVLLLLLSAWVGLTWLDLTWL